jgi:hypothetical protein
LFQIVSLFDEPRASLAAAGTVFPSILSLVCVSNFFLENEKLFSDGDVRHTLGVLSARVDSPVPPSETPELLSLRQSLADRDLELATLRAELAQLQSNLQTERDSAVAQLHNSEQVIASLRADLQNLSQQSNQHLEQCRADTSALHQQLTKQQTELTSVRKECDDQAASFGALMTDAEQRAVKTQVFHVVLFALNVIMFGYYIICVCFSNRPVWRKSYRQHCNNYRLHNIIYPLLRNASANLMPTLVTFRSVSLSQV